MPMHEPPELLLWGVPELRAGRVVVFAAERSFQLLTVLALQAGKWIDRDRIAALLWPDHPMGEARRNLRKVLFKAHAVVGPDRLDVSGSALRWSVHTDLQAFEADLRGGRHLDACARRRGTPLDGLDDPANAALGNWLAGERSRIDQAWHAAAMHRLHALDEPAARLEVARGLLAVDPLDEVAMAAQLQAQQALGRPADAREDYRRYAARLADEFGVEPSRAVRALLEASDASPGAGTEPATAGAAFIGRRHELAELGAMLARPDCRRITVIGPGGIGKSSLAKQALAAFAARHPGSSHWVELQDLADTAQFVARLAQTLGIDIADSQDPVPPLARRLNGAAMLLVLDNAEHLTELPALLERLLTAAPDLRLIVTSRVRLHGVHEWVLPLHGLAVPDDESRDAESAVNFDAVRLFDIRASAAQRGFRLDRHLPAVIEIVEAVGGMPLAIELAANWVHLLPPDEIARELRLSIDLLERDPGSPLKPARPEHESMRAVLERAWQLIAPGERQALEALSVFRGGFTRAAARRVASVALPLLSTLADKSLLAADDSGRFSMHPLVAAYAAQGLDDDAEHCGDLRTRHAEYFALHLAALTPHATGDPRLLVAGVEVEYANCAVAWHAAVECHRADLVYAMARSLWCFFEMRTRYVEGVAWLEAGLVLPEHHPATPRALTRLRNGLSMLLHRKGDHVRALSLARGGIEAGEDCGDTEAFVGCLLNTGMCLWAAGHAEEALPYYERGLAVSRERGDRHCIIWSTGNLGACLPSLGRIEEAEVHLRHALQGAREEGDAYNTVVNLCNLGNLVAWERRRPADAQALFEEALPLCRRYGLNSVENYIESNLGATCIEAGQHAKAREHLDAALARSQASGQLHTEWGCQLKLASLDIRYAQWPAGLRRLESVATATHARSMDWDRALAVAAFGDILAAQGDADGARDVWRWALDSGALDERRRRGLREKLEALRTPPEDDSRTVSIPTIESILSRLHAMARG